MTSVFSGIAIYTYSASVSGTMVSEPTKMLFLGFCLLAIAGLLRKLKGKNFD